MEPERNSARRSLGPLLIAVVGLACFAWLAWHGARGYWTSQAHEDVGSGLLSMFVIAMALWSAVASLLGIWLWRASKALSRRGVLTRSSLLAALGLGPPLFASWWMLELVLWAARASS